VDPILYGLDIETDTAAGGLDPSRAGIVAIAVSGPDGDEVYDGDEATLLRQVDQRLADLPPGVLVTWNGGAFDLPFIADRARRAGIELGLVIRHDPLVLARDPLPGHPGTYRGQWYDHRHLDGYRLYRADVGRTLGISCGLKPMARMTGLGPVEVDITELHLLSREEVAAYVASDARMARALVSRRLPHALASID
jgi:hypothetical protein